MQDNHEKITKEFCEGKTLIFSPRNTSEALYVQKRLHEMGFPWVNKGFEIAPAKFCINGMMMLRDGKIYGNPGPKDCSDSSLHCSVRQLRPDYVPAPVQGQGPAPRQRKPGLLETLFGPKSAPQRSANAVNIQVQNKGPVGNEDALEAAQQGIKKMIGLDQAKEDLEENIARELLNKVKKDMGIVVEPPSRHMVFTGPPGTGKTSVARELTNILYLAGAIAEPKFIEVTRVNVVEEYIGHTARNMQRYIDAAQGGILFIDEAYSLANKGTENKKDFGHEAIETLLTALENDRGNFIVIVAGYAGPMQTFINSNDGLSSRFINYVSFDSFSMDQLGQILDLMLEERGCTMTPEAREKSLEKLKEDMERKGEQFFGNARTVRNLIDLAGGPQASRLKSEGLLGKNHATDDSYRKAITTFTLADIEQVSLKGISSEKTAVAPSVPTMGFGASLETLRRLKPAAYVA